MESSPATKSELPARRERPANQKPPRRSEHGNPSSDRLQSLRVSLEVADIEVGAGSDSYRCRFVERADGTRRRPHDQRFFRKRLALSHQRAGADEAIGADARAVEHDRAHANQRMSTDRATVQDDIMADHA